jgi:hypothetical protein
MAKSGFLSSQTSLVIENVFFVGLHKKRVTANRGDRHGRHNLKERSGMFMPGSLRIMYIKYSVLRYAILVCM